jgi:Na+-driven multidrug efflux pump
LKSTEHGQEALAAYAIYYRVFQFVVMPAIAASVAMLPFAGRHFGENDVAGVRQGLRKAHLATVIYISVAAPILFLLAPLLARHLTQSPITLGYLIPALRWIPLVSLVAAPFFLCRPVFEGLGRGRPGLMMSVLRYLVLATPAAWLGLKAAPLLGVSEILGVILGLSVATAISSTVFLLWTRRTLNEVAKDAQNRTAAA